jgi:hypothetical protein
MLLLAGVISWTIRHAHPSRIAFIVERASKFDTSQALTSLNVPSSAETQHCSEADCGASPPDAHDPDPDSEENQQPSAAVGPSPIDPAGAAVEQTTQGGRAAIKMVASFDGLGNGFTGPQGQATTRNPSDNSLAVGPDYIVQIVNSRMAVFTKKGKQFGATGKPLYGPVITNTIFAGFGGQCENQVSGDAVVRYDQLAKRWLYVLPVFRRPPGEPNGPYYMCYAISAGPDPLGPYHRYAFKRTLFPDYPRPAIWTDGYYIPTSTGDDIIQKHACVADRTKMLQGLPATEQCVIVDGVNFLNSADIDGQAPPPAGAPNIIIAAGGTQLHNQFTDDGLYLYEMRTDWNDPSKTALSGPTKIRVAPYHYLCNGQLTNCVSQPGSDRKLDAQGDKLMQRLVYRNINGRESIVGLHSIDTKAGGGGIRWYEIRLDFQRKPTLFQQGTYAPDRFYRWMGSIGMDRDGNIGIGYSFGGVPHFPGQRFAARMSTDPPGVMTLHEAVLAEGEASQTTTLRWEDYATTVMDPSDDCTFWYVGDYLKAGASAYSTKIGAFRAPGCLRSTAGGITFFDRNHDGKRGPGEAGLAGVGVAYSGVQSGHLTSAADGSFSITLPSDPAYIDPVYTFTTAPAKGWSSTNGPARISLADGDNRSGDLGRVCEVKNWGGHDARFWRSGAGEKILKAHDNTWPRMAPRGFTPLPGSDGYRSLHDWLGSNADPAAIQVFVTSLNVAFGDQDPQSTVQDAIAGDWLTVELLLKRVEALPPAQRVPYVTLFENLNRNNLMATPSGPAGCSK